MPLYMHGDFSDLIHRKNKSCPITDTDWTVQRVVPLLLDLASALHHLHSKDISHSDVKSANALLDMRNDRLHVVLSDFSFAFVRGQKKRGVKGFQFSRADGLSLIYAAPELLQVMQNQLSVEEFHALPVHARDAYAFAILTIETILRDNPWKLPSSAALIQAVLNGQRPNTEFITKLSSMVQWLPILKIAEQLWSQDPHHRPPLAHVLSQLRALLPQSATGRTNSELTQTLKKK